jgi:hypothetical protein
MKNTLLILFLSTILSLVMSCNNDHDCPVPTPEPEDTVETIELNVPFLAKMGHDYRYIGEGDTLDLHLAGIFDGREYGVGCISSTGGMAEIIVISYINNVRYGDKLEWIGCDGTNEYDINNSNLPNYQAGLTGYTIKMMKMYPLSESRETTPEKMEAYEIKLVILK